MFTLSLSRSIGSKLRTYKVLPVVDEYTREVRFVEVRPKINAHNVLNALRPLLKTR